MLLPSRDAADVEGAHRELRAGLADRLGGDDADRLPQLGHAAGRQVAPVAADADPRAALAGQPGADLHPLDAGHLDLVREVLGDLLVVRR